MRAQEPPGCDPTCQRRMLRARSSFLHSSPYSSSPTETMMLPTRHGTWWISLGFLLALGTLNFWAFAEATIRSLQANRLGGVQKSAKKLPRQCVCVCVCFFFFFFNLLVNLRFRLDRQQTRTSFPNQPLHALNPDPSTLNPKP